MIFDDSSAQSVVLNIISNGLYSLISIPTKLTYQALKNKFTEDLENENYIDKLVNRILEIKESKNLEDLNKIAIDRTIREDKVIPSLASNINIKKINTKKTNFQILIGKGDNNITNNETY
ncbi:hypothetical protein [Vreelandella boliviensis]|uniref:Uncharacterized protein n=1 Tax=Vreelandella boliviensis LC1 TaxID=1072583 RepID=A0A265DU50_9GAMM|nr:hypothetical protein [Halomonas boliviensis]EHJ91801.1 hypothetical protein KUC_3358 [Halomonas boliviensis LC1]OZT72853.1 hypothetical protein CE457_16910 [Halomonas boliviensis LC1]